MMFYDTNHNSIGRVRDSLYAAFEETAMKMWAYIRCLPTSKQPQAALVIRK
jgi:hypothetical protein